MHTAVTDALQHLHSPCLFDYSWWQAMAAVGSIIVATLCCVALVCVLWQVHTSESKPDASSSEKLADSQLQWMPHAKVRKRQLAVEHKQGLGALRKAAQSISEPFNVSACRPQITGQVAPSNAPTVHVAMSVNRDQVLALFVCATSLLSHTRSPHAIKIHLLVDRDTVRLVQQVLDCLGTSVSARFEVHQVKTAAYSLLRGGSKDAVANLVRFYLPQLLPRVDKVLWVDADGLVMGDVYALMSTVFEGAHTSSAIASVERPGKTLKASTGLGPRELTRLALWNVKPNDAVFNAGFIALNLRIWREETTTERVEQLVRKLRTIGFRGFPGISTKSAKGVVHDSQTPLVLHFKNISGSIQRLPPEWNIEGLGWKLVKRDKVCAGRFLHWSGGHKPWNDLKATYIPLWELHARMGLGKCYSVARH